MSDIPRWFVGNRNPSIAQTITIDGAPVDLSGTTVQFRARPVGGTALLVDAAATIVDAASGEVRYDWAPADITTGGALTAARNLLVWWEVTTTSGGRTQDLNEALIEVRDHSVPDLPPYIELEQFKSAAELTDTTYADLEIEGALLSASRGIDGATNRRFWLDPADTVRYYTPGSYRRLMVDDLVSVTSLQIDRSGDGAYEETWTEGTHFVLEPFNAAADVKPYESVLRRTISGYVFPCGIEQSVKVTGRFGWPAVPAGVQTATLILASKLVKRVREAPFGIIVVGGRIDNASAIRIARNDPDIVPLLAEFVRNEPFAS